MTYQEKNSNNNYVLVFKFHNYNPFMCSVYREKNVNLIKEMNLEVGEIESELLLRFLKCTNIPKASVQQKHKMDIRL